MEQKKMVVVNLGERKVRFRTLIIKVDVVGRQIGASLQLVRVRVGEEYGA